MLFDTTFLIDYEREIKRNRLGPVHDFLAKNPTAPLFISVISAGEFAEGFDAGQEQDCWLCLHRYSILTIDREIAWQAGQLSRQLRAGGQTVGDNDLWIAATALHHKLAVVTANVQHFQMIGGLQVISY
jgi:predicted nucleic acid-binding protein